MNELNMCLEEYVEYLQKGNKYYFYSTELARIEFDFDAFFIKIYKKSCLCKSIGGYS